MGNLLGKACNVHRKSMVRGCIIFFGKISSSNEDSPRNVWFGFGGVPLPFGDSSVSIWAIQIGRRWFDPEGSLNLEGYILGGLFNSQTFKLKFTVCKMRWEPAPLDCARVGVCVCAVALYVSTCCFLVHRTSQSVPICRV